MSWVEISDAAIYIFYQPFTFFLQAVNCSAIHVYTYIVILQMNIMNIMNIRRWFMKFITSFIGLIFSAIVLLQTGGGAFAQSYPNKPIRFIVVFVPGGSTDILARAIGQKLGESWGQPVVIDNRGGAGGVIGTEMGARAEPDGYTITMVSASHAFNPSLYGKLPYDTIRDFIPLTNAAFVPNILTVHPSVPVKSVKEFIALAKAKPGGLNYSSAGKGSAIHLAAELFMSMTGIKMTHIPYKGGGQALIQLMGGEADCMFSNLASSFNYVKSGRLRALGVTTLERSPVYPDIPTIAESGVPGYEFVSWFGVVAPARTPKEITAKLSNEIVKILNRPDTVDQLRKIGMEPIGDGPEKFAVLISAEMKKWEKVIREADIRIQ
jgi:tripartite-type tricarboxylate transporter receptor subunit TctC